MTFKTSWYKISPAVFRENLRRLWYIPTIAFVFMFIFALIPIYMIDTKDSLAQYLHFMFGNKHPGTIMINMILPVVSALSVFRYMHGTASVTYINSLPYSRGRLFNTNLLTGWLLSVVPSIALSLIFLIISKPVYYKESVYGSDMVTNINVFAPSVILTWLGLSVVSITFVYAISVFAGTVTGTTVHHLIGAIGFNALFPCVSLALSTYGEKYLTGFVFNSDVTFALSPVLRFIAHPEYITNAKYMSIYIGVGILVFVLSYFLYQIRQMERAGDGVTFGFMVPIVSYIFAFFGMTAMALYLWGMAGSREEYFYLGLITGAFIFLTIGRMVVLKTARVFNKALVKNLVIYGIVATLFVSAFAIDVFGYAGKTPPLSKIDYIKFEYTVYDGDADYGYDRYNAQFFKPLKPGISTNSESGGEMSLIISDRENIKFFTELQKDAFGGKNAKFADPYESTGRAYISYFNGNKKLLRRSFEINIDEFNKYLNDVFFTKEIKDFYSFNNLVAPVKSASIWGVGGIHDPEKVKNLMAALEKDFQNSGNIGPSTGISIDLQFDWSGKKFNPYESGQLRYEETMRVLLKETDVNTLECLKSMGINIDSIGTQNIESVKVTYLGKTVKMDNPSKYGDLFREVSTDTWLNSLPDDNLYKCEITMKSGYTHVVRFSPDNVPWPIEELFI